MTEVSRTIRFLATLPLVTLVLLLAAPQAQAETEDVVRSLDATYAVQRDGSIDVTYQLDWDFGRTGAHGIELSLVTVEQWEDDPTQEAVYDITDLDVTSPTGVPTDLDTYSDDISGTLDLRIGDPDVELDVKRATYVVTYTLDGALRTVDGNPQLYWDVTSYDFPAIDDFTITVTGPAGIPRARCLQGSDECRAEVDGDRAVLTGSQVETGDTLTAVAEFEAGSVKNAEPNLRERELRSPALVEMDSTVEIGADGVARVMEHLLVKTSPENSEVEWELPERRSLSWYEDQLFTLSDITVTDRDGIPLEIEHSIRSEGDSHQHDQVEVELPEGSEKADTVELIAGYTVEGAVVSDGDGPASFVWPISTFESRDYDVATTETVTWNLPGEVSSVDCRYQADLGNPNEDCSLADQLSSQGDAAIFERINEGDSGPLQWVVIDFAPDSVGQLEPTTDWSSTARGVAIAALIVVAVLVFPVLGWQLSRVRLGAARDERYDGVPPGTMWSDGRVTTAGRGGPIPVRFTPPEESFTRVGLAVDRRSRPRHLAATLINMAVNGAVQLQSKPLAIWQRDESLLTSDFERSLYKKAQPEGADGELSESARTSMARKLEGQLKQTVNQGDLIRALPVLGRTTLIWALAPLLIIIAGVVGAVISWGGWLGLSIAAAVLLIAGVLFGVRLRPRSRTAKGTALAEQALGFRQYLCSAESQQLNFEADQDIYRRYLPWAVLFNEVDRWTKACQELAAAGRIEPPDTSFMVGVGSLSSLSGDLRGFTSSVSTSTSSGSGGSSGFSGGASGGGGGGGTSAGSW